LVHQELTVFFQEMVASLPVWGQIGLSLLIMVLGILLAFAYEARGAPRLKVELGRTSDYVSDIGRVRFPHIKVINVPRWAPLVTKRTAASAHGWITFRDGKGNKVGGRMPIRWNGAPQPLSPYAENGKVKYMYDERFLRAGRFLDIAPGESETLSPAMRLAGDFVAWGWTSESYKFGWKHKDFRLPPGTYAVRVEVATGDKTFAEEFTLLNPLDFDSFCLEGEPD